MCTARRTANTPQCHSNLEWWAYNCAAILEGASWQLWMPGFLYVDPYGGQTRHQIGAYSNGSGDYRVFCLLAGMEEKTAEWVGDVVVVGAGICGLYVARKLEEQGRKVIVLEAQNRLGGELSRRVGNVG